MTPIEQRILAATVAFAMAVFARQAMGQTALSPDNLDPSLLTVAPEISFPSPPLFSYIDSDIKFELWTLMDILRDSRHESWVLAAYPDPKTSRPLIGAGFSLDVRATDHVQYDPLNPHTFIEPSSVQLWQAAGLSLERLQIILAKFEHDLNTWKKKNFRRKIKTHQLSPQLTDEEATKLLQISVVVAVQNARAYCRDFDQLTASQQMALSQLVYQMGVNLEEFTQFLSVINDLSYRDSGQTGSNPEREVEHWTAVQRTLIESDWARRYTSRAVTVIAMFDPDYDENPTKAELQVRAVVQPLVMHHRKARTRSVQRGNSLSHPHSGGRDTAGMRLSLGSDDRALT